MSTQELDKDRIALGIKQPWAELILQGIKTIEVRSRPTNVRGRIYLYASHKPATQDFAEAAINKFQLQLTQCPNAVVVGSVVLENCRPALPADAKAACVPAHVLKDHYAWEMSQPERLAEPQPIRFRPYGIWFYPYKRRPEKWKRS